MLSPVDFASIASRMRRSSALSSSSTDTIFSLSAGDCRHDFDLGAVRDQRSRPITAPHDVTVDSDCDSPGINRVSGQELNHVLADERLTCAIEANHERLRANSTASRELDGAKVTPCR